jgi:hypothetical protein
MFVDYLAPLGTSTLHSNQELWIDFNKCRAITLEGPDGFYTLTTVNDLANVVVRAIDFADEWPVIGGVHGTTISSSKILELGAKILSTYRTQLLFCSLHII